MTLRHIFVAMAAVMLTSAAVADAATDNKTITTVSYVEGAVDGKQPALSGMAGVSSGQAVLYTSTAGTLSGRDIVNNTSSYDSEADGSTKLVQNGVVVSKLGGKQNNITAPQNTAVTYGATAGALGSQAIYQSSGAYTTDTTGTQNNLAQADHVNGAVQNAMRAHMVCNDCEDTSVAIASACPATSCLLWDVNNNLAGVYVPQNQL